MANLKISDLTAYTTPLSADLLPIVDTSNATTKKVTIANFLNVLSNLFTIKDSSDTTKKLAFNVSGITTATTRTLTVPDANTTVVGTDTTQTLTNKTLSTGTKINTSGSDATGSMYYRDASGNLTGVSGTNGQIVSLNASNIPTFIPNPAATDASTTVKGVVEIATDAEMNAGTATGSTGAILAIAASSAGAVGANKLVWFTSANKYPANDGSLITNLTNPVVYTNGTTTKDTTDASTTQNIAHGLGKIPKRARLIFDGHGNGTGTAHNIATLSYNGTTSSVVGSGYANAAYRNMNAGGNVVLYGTVSGAETEFQTGVVTFDSTNIIITWTKSNSPTGDYQILWEAEA